MPKRNSCGPKIVTVLEPIRRSAASRLRERRFAVRDLGVHEVHRRRADEAGDEAGGRPSEHVARGAHLLDEPVVHDHDAVGERHRLDLVVGDVIDGRVPRRGAADLDAHLLAQRRVEVRQRLVEQEHPGGARSPAPSRHAGAGRPRAARAPVDRSPSSSIVAASSTRASISAADAWRSSAGTPCSRARSCAGRARSPGRPSRRRARAAARR